VRHAQIFRGFALLARRDIFFIGDCASPNPNAKGRALWNPHVSAITFDRNSQLSFDKAMAARELKISTVHSSMHGQSHSQSYA